MPNLDRPVLTKPKSINSLTGLRFFAALVVVITHAHTRSTGMHVFGPYATNAVTFFFVLSGFILTYVYQERIATIGKRKFFIARFARIWPLHIVCIALTIWVDWYFGHGAMHRGGSWPKLSTNIALIHSWIPISNWPMQYNGPSWSISTELGFYILFPLLILIAKRGYGKMVLACFCLAGTITAGIQMAVHAELLNGLHAVQVAYVNPLTRLVDFAVGMWVADLFIRRSKLETDQTPKQSYIKDTTMEVLALLLLGFLFYQFNYGVIPKYLSVNNLVIVRSWFARGVALMPGFAAVMWVFSRSDGMMSRFLSKPLLMYLGEISFALYLVQIAVMEYMKFLLVDAYLPVFYQILLAVTISIGFSMLLYAAVEMPLRQLIVSASELNWRKAAGSFSTAKRNLAKGNVGLIGLAIAAFGCGVVVLESTFPVEPIVTEPVPISESIQIANQLHGVDFEPVVFKGEATLLWLQVEETEKTAEISLWWQLDKEHQRVRFMHFSDEYGKILAQGHSNSQQFVGKPGGANVVEKISIEKASIADGVRYIGIGFWKKGIGTARAMSGKRQMHDHRLLIAEITPQGIVGIATGHEKQHESVDAGLILYDEDL